MATPDAERAPRRGAPTANITCHDDNARPRPWQSHHRPGRRPRWPAVRQARETSGRLQHVSALIRRTLDAFDPLEGCIVVGDRLIVPYDPRLDPGAPEYVEPVHSRLRILDDDYPELDGLDEWREWTFGGMR